jgi:uncharacterized protein GlcG (DUF336 family)
MFAIAGALLFQVSPAHADSGGYTLPLDLAAEAATEAINVCEFAGYKVSAAVVDSSGVLKFFAKGDKSTIHTKDASYRKAYTVVTMGPIFKFDTSGQFAQRFAKDPSPPALATLPDIILGAGAVAIRVKGEIVAALGISGAPGGAPDEVCAQAGLEKIVGRLPK